MDWERFFPYETPYQNQPDAIERALSVLEDGGFFTMEGACGTGKTVTSLTAGATLVRSPTSQSRRLVVATSVKNQLQQFVTESRIINETLPTGTPSLRGIMLVGKADLHPYLREGIVDELPPSMEFSDLRERAVELVKRDSDIPLNVESEEFGGDTWYDPNRAETIQRRVTQQVEAVEVRDESHADGTRTTINTLETAGIDTPYPATPPLVEDVVSGDPDELPEEHRGPFDPFFVGFIAQDGELPFGYSDAPGNVITREELLKEAASQGICPHESMALLGATADIVIGNYNHVFDPATRYLTDQKMGILDEETLLIVDEAHALEARARDLFSDGLGDQTITTARNDLRGALQVLAAGQVISLAEDDPRVPPEGQLSTAQQDQREKAEAVLERLEITPDHLRVLRDALTWLTDTFLDALVRKHLRTISADWEATLTSGDPPVTTDERFSLESDEADETDIDALTRALTGYLEDQCSDTDLTVDEILESLPVIGQAVSSIWKHVGDRDEQCRYLTQMLSRWIHADTVRYYRELELDYSPNTNPGEWEDWDDIYNASLALYNCIPADDLANMVDELGGGVFMSATLEPHDVFQDVNGLSIIDQARGRPVDTATYGMHFPESNRASLIAPLPPFTYDNRGQPTTDSAEMTATRRQYADFLRGIAGTYGNILIGMPSYDEAAWVHELLRADTAVEKEVLLDTSSTHEETQALLEDFWTDTDARILTTSLRGTVTEGVDYPGDKLHTAVIVGVPLSNTTDPRMQAVKDAYAERFGSEHDFEYAFTIPGVRKARQALGRVIRSQSDVGVRLLVDQRYTPQSYQSVHPYLSTQEQDEFKVVERPVESTKLFWQQQRSHPEL